ncbi:rod shape-determining protein RodA [Clostridium formicaceticum]|uniref:Peptidoglycan glycosyltransferase RodA n=1 Tax=Clostridium formicaceticum TaxID=1497 RepID=A0AAC9RGM0_9CLOT|nr:rod shape-determining protein RodA [Clostridium formicaceticum]AOY76184.1 rod shape-determining protein RodA [Clostridium formicaceticum]ARE86556.1 Rod shape-determining protein RodA [Clostridium formicaceticum]
MKLENKLIKKINFSLIIVVLMICIIGIIMIASATHSLGYERYIRTQISSVAMGFVAIIIILFVDYSVLARLYMPIYVFSNLLLMSVLLFGAGADSWGANRWIRIGGFQFQPSDFAKIGIIICLAKMIDDHKDSIYKLSTIAKILLFAGLPMGLIARQPDLGTTMAFGFFTLGMIFIAGLKYKHIFITAIIGMFSVPLAWLTFLKPYQKDRILTFLNPDLDPMGKGYHAIQSRMAVGNGMIFGKGLFRGTQSQFGFLPEKHTDFIFSVLAEELGFLGVSVLIILYIIMLIKCVNIARDAKDDFGAYIVTGVTFMLAFHIFSNIGMTIGLMPVTGKPLPFVSYGGTFMLSNMMALGLVLNVNMRRDKINF